MKIITQCPECENTMSIDISLMDIIDNWFYNLHRWNRNMFYLISAFYYFEYFFFLSVMLRGGYTPAGMFFFLYVLIITAVIDFLALWKFDAFIDLFPEVRM